jgi:Viral BACON domain
MSNGPLSVGLSFALYLNSSKTLPLAIVNRSDEPLSWNADTRGANWLSLDRKLGTLKPHEIQTIYATAHSGHTTGDFQGRLIFKPIEGGNPSQDVELLVELHVSLQIYSDNGPKAPVVRQNRFDLVSERPGNMLQSQPSSLQFSNPADNGQVQWAMKSTVSWLIIEPKTGTLEGGKEQIVNVKTDQNAGTEAGTYTTDLMLTLTLTDPTKKDREPTSVLIPISLIVP